MSVSQSQIVVAPPPLGFWTKENHLLSEYVTFEAIRTQNFFEIAQPVFF